MKRILFLFLIVASMTVVAQESIPQDTTLYLNGRKVVIKEHDGKIKVKMYEAKAENDTIENTQVFEGVYLDGRSIERTTTVSVPFVKKRKATIALIALPCYLLRFQQTGKQHIPIFCQSTATWL